MSIRLIDQTEIKIRFGEVDSMGIVWHGNYAKYIEEGRESFGNHFGISYLEIYSNKLMAPVVNMNIDYKKQVNYGDTLLVETEYIDSESAKIIFHYRLFRKSDSELVATAQTTQVFITLDREMLFYPPTFALEWKARMGLTKSTN